MVEITHGGAWFKWSGLNARDKRLAALSIGAGFPPCILIGMVLGHWSHTTGFWLGSGGRKPGTTGLEPFFASPTFSYLVLASTLLAVLSALAWWRFSVHQDEMFNRIQNYAIGQAGGWTLGLAILWWLLSLGNWVGEFSFAGLISLGTILLLGFWFHAVRRWL